MQFIWFWAGRELVRCLHSANTWWVMSRRIQRPWEASEDFFLLVIHIIFSSVIMTWELVENKETFARIIFLNSLKIYVFSHLWKHDFFCMKPIGKKIARIWFYLQNSEKKVWPEKNSILKILNSHSRKRKQNHVLYLNTVRKAIRSDLETGSAGLP